MLFLLNLRKHSSQTELDRFFQKHLGLDDDVQHITKSAFFQSRMKLKHSAFLALNHQLISDVYKNKQHVKTWKGFRLCAIDGTSIRLPDENDLIEYFGEHSGRTDQAKCTMGMASVFYDVMNHLVIDSTLERSKTSERLCAANHLGFAQPDDLIVYDRGYPAHWFYQLHEHHKLHFCMRMRTSQTVAKDFIRTGKREQIITLEPNRIARKRYEEEGVSSAPIKLRLVRVDLPNDVEVLVTNLLDRKKYHPAVFKSLYHLRWGVEENYKRLKQWVEIENFSGKSVESVKQDFYAKIVSSNLTALITKCAHKKVKQKTKNRRLKYQVNFAQALSKMKHKLIAIIVNDIRRKGLIVRAIKYITKTTESVREERSYPRKLKNIKNNIHFSCYKCSL